MPDGRPDLPNLVNGIPQCPRGAIQIAGSERGSGGEVDGVIARVDKAIHVSGQY
jgi:hypothetical protein